MNDREKAGRDTCLSNCFQRKDSYLISKPVNGRKSVEVFSAGQNKGEFYG